jgi:hypothetical protein
VCAVTWDDAKGALCPQCGYDAAAEGARDPARLNEARKRFRDQTTAYAPDSRVTAWDKWRPWASVVLGFVLFMLWLRACYSHGWHIF